MPHNTPFRVRHRCQQEVLLRPRLILFWSNSHEFTFGLRALDAGNWVPSSRSVLVISLSPDLLSLSKTLDLKYKKIASGAEDFWHSEDFASGLAKLGNDPANPFRQLAIEGREATAHHRNTKAHLHDALDVSDWVTRSLRNTIDEFTSRLQSGLAILASVGSTAPFIGLFGTVWGIYHALLAIGTAGQATIDKVAAHRRIAAHDALGLAVLFPVLGYTLGRGNKGVLQTQRSRTTCILLCHRCS